MKNKLTQILAAALRAFITLPYPIALTILGTLCTYFGDMTAASVFFATSFISVQLDFIARQIAKLGKDE